MKKIFTLAIIALSMAVSCQKDPLAEIEKGDWNKEKRLIGIKFAQQAGDATISINVDDISKGTAGVTIVNPDLSKPLTINEMEISYGASASVKKGDELKFDENTYSAEIVVTAATGGSRTYTITVTPLIETLEGIWDISTLDIFGGTGADYGGVDFVNLFADQSWWDGTTGPNAELDNYLEFTFEGVDENGLTYGKCVHNAGEDGLYADFVWKGELPEGQTVTDVNYNYRKIPAGEFTWKRDYSTGEITFENEEGFKSACTFIESGEIEYWGKKLNIADNALKFSPLDKAGSWGPIYSAYDKIVYMPWDYYVQIKKR